MAARASSNPAGEQEDNAHYKNRLQDFAMKAWNQLPVYESSIEGGTRREPQFRSTVIVNGERYVAPFTSHPRKQAEQLAAKFALKSVADKIIEKIKKEGVPPNVVAFCKWMLQEYAGKSKKPLQTYTTTRSDATPHSKGPTFISTVEFDGKTYMGDIGRSKKDAERSAARTVIERILGQSDDDAMIFLVESIILKGKHTNSAGRGNGSQDKSMPLTAPGDNHSDDIDMPSVSRNGRLPAENSMLPTAEKPPKRHICEIIQINKEVSSEDPQMLQDDLHSSTSTPKLSRKKQKKGSNSKKM